MEDRCGSAATLGTIIALKEGGFLVGGSIHAATGYESDFLTKLNGDGKVLWTKSTHSGDINNKYSIEDVMEDDCGDYFLLLAHAPGLTKLLRTGSAYSIKWSTLVDDVPFYGPTLFRSDHGILVLSSQHDGNSSDIVFESYSDSGDMKWRNRFGGTGNEGASSILSFQSGYYLFGFTLNWFEAGYIGVNRSYIIKTDLEGKSCQ